MAMLCLQIQWNLDLKMFVYFDDGLLLNLNQSRKVNNQLAKIVKLQFVLPALEAMNCVKSDTDKAVICGLLQI